LSSSPLLEGRVADDAADRGSGGESPGALVAIGKGGVGVGAALDSDGAAVLVQDLAAELLVDLVAELEADGADLGSLANVLGLALAVAVECELPRKLGISADLDTDLVGGLAGLNLHGLGGGNRSGSGQGGGGGQEGEEGAGELHFDWLEKRVVCCGGVLVW